MSKFIKENWFKIIISLTLLAIAISVVYYLVIFLPKRNLMELEQRKQQSATQLQQQEVQQVADQQTVEAKAEQDKQVADQQAEQAKLGQQKKVMDDMRTIATEVINYTPQQDLPSKIEEGFCWISSLAAPYRQDAWRCMVGNYIYDPCFNLSQNGYVLCDVNPKTRNSGFRLKLTEPLPKPNAPVYKNAFNSPWLVELRDGTPCFISIGASAVVKDIRANYICNPSSNDESYLMGDLKSGRVWTAEKANLALKDSDFIIKSSENVIIKAVWR